MAGAPPHGSAVQVVDFDGHEDLTKRISCTLRILRVSDHALPYPAPCAVVAAPDLARADVQSYLRRLEHEAPATPIVLVTGGNSRNMSSLGPLRADAVVVVEEIEARLAIVVQAFLERDTIEAMAVEIENAAWLDADLRCMLTTILRTVPPIRSETRVAAVCHIKPKRIWQISADLVDQTGWKLLNVMQATPLLRIGLLRPHRRAVQDALRELKIAERSAERWSRALVRAPLHECAKKPELVEARLRAFVRALLSRVR